MSFVNDTILKSALGKIKAWGEGKFVAKETGKGLLQMTIQMLIKQN